VQWVEQKIKISVFCEVPRHPETKENLKIGYMRCDNKEHLAKVLELNGIKLTWANQDYWPKFSHDSDRGLFYAFCKDNKLEYEHNKKGYPYIKGGSQTADSEKKKTPWVAKDKKFGIGFERNGQAGLVLVDYGFDLRDSVIEFDRFGADTRHPEVKDFFRQVGFVKDVEFFANTDGKGNCHFVRARDAHRALNTVLLCQCRSER